MKNREKLIIKWKISYIQRKKDEIVKRYMNGEKVVHLTKELWPNSKICNHKNNIYDWIKKYKGYVKYRTKKISIIKKERLNYSQKFKYNIVMKYLNGKTALNLAKEMWSNKNPETTRTMINYWRKQLISKK
ncbi:hypothetical protein [Candidatus Mycoplasma mahonii]|uniref:hypothetical protein n=1 Tax=Candidatus Mycoplasma mahonii TaxID=3004105 RepID=UPI0026EFA905|nr:hypothetical protein [Candidatus Mycoplasma mahonii]WKX02203.1 hypothetical protein O3I44_02250 [Candidatus Mycoplasma mahonii]